MEIGEYEHDLMVELDEEEFILEILEKNSGN